MRSKTHHRLTGVFVLFLCALLAACQGTQEATPNQNLPALIPPARESDASNDIAAVFSSRELIITGETLWRYVDEDAQSYITEQWASPFYDDSTWKEGRGSFGAKDGKLVALSGDFLPEQLLVQYYGNDTTKSLPSYFFRTNIDVPDPESFSMISARLAYDDAVIVYLNGERIFHANTPEEEYESVFSYGSLDGLGSPNISEFRFSADLLVPGNNTIAVELHQDNKGSSDVYFDFISLETAQANFSQVSIGLGSDETAARVSWQCEGREYKDASIQVWPTYEITKEKSTYLAKDITKSADGFAYRADIVNLAPGTNYTYAIQCGSFTYGGMFDTGNPEDGVGVLLLGDPQMGAANESPAKALGEYVKANREGVDFLIALGDLSRDATDAKAFELAVNAMFQAGRRMASVIGNHDIGTEYFSRSLYLPNMSKTAVSEESGDMSGNYWFSYGNVLFLCLNSNITEGRLHEAFLTDTISKYTAAHGEPQWKILLMHHSPYSNGYHADNTKMLALREELTPVFQKNGIHIVFSGHDHTYSRSHIMEGANIIPNATGQVSLAPGQLLYLTLNSSSGSKYYDLAEVQHEYTAVCSQEYEPNITKAQITQNEIQLLTFNPETGETVDSLVITKMQETAK